MAIVLRFRERKVADDEEDFVTELEHQPELGRLVALKMRQVFQGTRTLKDANFTEAEFEKMLILAARRKVTILL